MKHIYKILLLGLVSTSIFLACSGENSNNQNSAMNKVHPAKKAKSGQKAENSHMNTGGLEWLTFEQAAKMKNKGSKKYLVDVYTDWCGWCKVMDKQTFTNPEVQAFLNENFHVIKFNAEQKEAIDFRGKKYEWLPAGRRGVNKLAMELLGSRLSYPTLVYLDENMNKIRSSPGFKKPDQLLSELRVITGS
ncbi:MAG: DUF255 domain-containing protein [Bacteroidia bacterium]|nr:DUF255 domain-containing protein [Bacteroidia bacterium]